jgi:hypothetical protein
MKNGVIRVNHDDDGDYDEVMKIAMIVGHDKNCIDDYANCL